MPKAHRIGRATGEQGQSQHHDQTNRDGDHQFYINLQQLNSSASYIGQFPCPLIRVPSKPYLLDTQEEVLPAKRGDSFASGHHGSWYVRASKPSRDCKDEIAVEHSVSFSWRPPNHLYCSVPQIWGGITVPAGKSCRQPLEGTHALRSRLECDVCMNDSHIDGVEHVKAAAYQKGIVAPNPAFPV